MVPRKTLTFLGADGAGKKTLVGQFVWKMGPDMALVERLEKNNIRRLNEMQPFMEQHGIEMPVDLSPHAYHVIGLSQEPDVAAWVVDATSPDAGERSSRGVSFVLVKCLVTAKREAAGIDQQNVQTFFLILVAIVDLRHRDKINWSEPDFNAVASRFQGLDCLPSGTSIIPVSGFEGTNLVDVPGDIVWMNQSPAGGEVKSGVVLGKCLADLLY
ncbi:hypothetical protein PG997_006719 [Apiospora hydei]|uniref:Uncharacterized protein n=1 Tax=Apiospora hydei TaxID=1337664 RepID=A0ABR1WPV9_9PEZI